MMATDGRSGLWTEQGAGVRWGDYRQFSKRPTGRRFRGRTAAKFDGRLRHRVRNAGCSSNEWNAELETDNPAFSLSQGKYAVAEQIADRKAFGISKGTYLRVHFKNTRYDTAIRSLVDILSFAIVVD